jgi:hypothetical protein
MADLRGERPQTERSGLGKVIGFVIAAAILAGVGAYAYETWPAPPHHSVVADNQLPSSS